jgi:hypothetical protein
VITPGAQLDRNMPRSPVHGAQMAQFPPALHLEALRVLPGGFLLHLAPPREPWK